MATLQITNAQIAIQAINLIKSKELVSPRIFKLKQVSQVKAHLNTVKEPTINSHLLSTLLDRFLEVVVRVKSFRPRLSDGITMSFNLTLKDKS